MDANFIDLTEETLPSEHLCCIIRKTKPHPGVEAKRAWLADRLREGHVFRKLDTDGCCFIEYAPLETAWVPVTGQGYFYLYCLWTLGDCRGKGYGRVLLESCIADAKAKGAAGICMLGAKKQKNWLSDQSFAKKFGFVPVDSTADGYELLALRFDPAAELPRFTDRARAQRVDTPGLAVYYSPQCPFILQKVEALRACAAEQGIPAAFTPVKTLEQAKALPGVFNNFGAFWNGAFLSVNLLDVPTLEKLWKRSGQT